MGPARIEHVAEHIRQRLIATAIDEIQTPYNIGVVAHALRYGGAPLPQEALAARFGMDLSNLRRHARVSETIKGDELTEILSLRTPAGVPLSWSHLEVLACVRGSARRRALATLAAAESLSVRALKARVNQGYCE